MKGWVKRWGGLVSLIIFCGSSPAQASPVTPQKPPPPAQTVPAAKMNDETSRMKRLQELLAATGFYPGQATGRADISTQDAIRKGQTAFKLKVTGQYDLQLVDVLSREISTKPVKYRTKLTMEASAYTSADPGCGQHTKRGNQLRKGLVAVDPKIIPLGTRLYVDGYGYAIADDVGSAIKGNKIDLAYDSRKDALRFGRQKITVYILH